MSLLTIVQHVCNQIGIPAPTVIVNGTDQTSKTMLALANKSGQELSRLDTDALMTEATFTTVATEDQGLLSTLATGYRYMLEGTMFNRTQMRPVPGSLTPQRWELYKATVVSGPYSEFFIRRGHLYFKPIPTAGQTVAFMYASKNWCQSAALVGQSAWAADTDTGVLDEELLEYDLIWRYKQSRGLEFQPEHEMFKRFRDNLLGQDGRAPTLNMAKAYKTHYPIGVPEGNWNL